MTREQWRVVWRWMRVEKKRLAWEHGPWFPERWVRADSWWTSPLSMYNPAAKRRHETRKPVGFATYLAVTRR